MGEGGEAHIFETNIPDLVAKIYEPKHRTKIQEAKIKFMINNPINDKSLCWPTGILKHNGKFIGIVMPYIRCDNNNTYVHPDNMQDDPKEWAEIFNNDKKNSIKIIINTIKIFELMRNHNIVIGDFNLKNIFINTKTCDVILIDLDSIQIDKYPSILCKEKFNAPEIIRGITDPDISDGEETRIANQYYHKKYSTFDRDNFSLAVFIFYLLTGRFPYYNAFNASNIDFPFHPSNEQIALEHNINANETRSKIWTHLPFFVREALYKCFTTKDPKERLTPKKWKEVFKYYLSILENGQLLELDNGCNVMINSDYIPYNTLGNVKLLTEITLNSYGFTMKDAIKKLYKKLKKEINIESINFSIDLDMVSEYLKYNRVLKLEKCTFKLLFNIGVYKKVSIKYTYS